MATEQQRKLMVKLALRMAAVAAAGLVIAAGFRTRPSMCDGAIPDVLKKSDYEAVLALESRNVAERIAHAERRLAGNALDTIGAFADLPLAEMVDSSAVNLVAMKGQTYAQLDLSAADRLVKPPTAVPDKHSPIVNSIGMSLKLLPAGRFHMGSTTGDSDEKPVHEVTLTAPFYMGGHEVTQEQYELVMGNNPSSFKGRATNPVENVSWKDAVEFCVKLTSMPAEKSSARVYRLPSEAEWEYACRAGTSTAYNFGTDASQLSDYAWFKDNSGGSTHPIGKKQPDGWGLYDMHGNVWEWCQDWKGDYPSGSVTNPRGPPSGSNRVYRGGSWRSKARSCRSADRFKHIRPPGYRDNRLGFRVVLDVPS